jgi:CheY-like chemotaxis protein
MILLESNVSPPDESKPEEIEPQSQTIIVLPEAHPIPPGHPDPGRTIRVMLVDDHAVVRQGIANLLGDESDLEVIGEAADGREAVELAAGLIPDVILMDTSMPNLNGVEATRIIHNDWPDIRIIGLSMFEEPDSERFPRNTRDEPSPPSAFSERNEAKAIKAQAIIKPKAALFRWLFP